MNACCLHAHDTHTRAHKHTHTHIHTPFFPLSHFLAFLLAQMAISEIGVSFPDDTFGKESRFGIPFT